MIDLPDAPWIRDAEINGMPEDRTIYCPMCGAESPDQFIIQEGEVIGCECCTKRVSAYGWYADHRTA